MFFSGIILFIVNKIIKGVINIKRIIKYIIITIVIISIIIFTIFNNKKEDEIIIEKENNTNIIENVEKMVYLIDKKNSNIDELLKDNIVIKYETIYTCIEEPTNEEIVEDVTEEEIVEEPVIEEIEEPKYKGIVDNKYYDDNYKLREEFTVKDGKVYYEDKKGLQLVDGIRYYFDFNDRHLVRSSIKSVIDISSWQGDIDFDKLKESNLVDAVIVRVGYGTTNSKCGLDNKFERNINELNRLNIPYGIYIYGYAQNEYSANIEANFVYDMINKYNVNLSYPVFYDAELRSYLGVSYTKNLYTKVINAFTSNLESKGIKTGVYGNLYMLTKGSLNDPSIRNKTIWVAQYYNKCQYDGDYIGWQYSSNGSIPGINGRVDVNIFNY